MTKRTTNDKHKHSWDKYKKHGNSDNSVEVVEQRSNVGKGRGRQKTDRVATKFSKVGQRAKDNTY